MTQCARCRLLAGSLAIFHSFLAALAPPAQADQIEFQNGDRLTGTIVGMAGGKLTLKSDVAGKLEIPLSSVRTFSTAEPIALHLADGSVVNDSFAASAPGEVRAAESARSLAFDLFEAINPPEPAWHGSINAGASFERGNTFTNSGHGGFNTERDFDSNTLSFYGHYHGERNRNLDTKVNTTTKRNIFGGARLDHSLTDRWSWYGLTEYEKDGVQDLDLRFRASSGPTYHWWKGDSFGLSTDAGLSWISSRYEDRTADEDYAALRTGWDLYWQVVSSTRFYHSGSWEPSLEDIVDVQLLKTTTGLRTSLTDSVFIEGKLLWDLNSEPAAGRKRADADYIFAIGYSF